MPPTTKCTAAFISLLSLILAAGSACTPAPAPAEETARAELINNQAEVVGEADFTETGAGVKMDLTVQNLPPGSYSVQVHEMGVCEGPGFLSAGEPYPPAEEVAMIQNVAGPVNRSIARFQVVDGAARVEAVIPVVTLLPGDNSLFHPGGTALIIDNLSPAGVYEGRIACGAITKTPQHEAGALPRGGIESARQPDNLGTPGKKYQRPKAVQ